MRTILAFVLSSIALLATAASSDDFFEALDRELEAEFQQTDAELERQFQELDRALKEAFARMEEEVASEWGQQEVELPTRQKWTDYSDDLQARRVIDFERGEVRIEMLADDRLDTEEIARTLAESASSIKEATQADLSKRDRVLQYAKESLKGQVDLEKYDPEGDRPIIGELMEAPPDSSDIQSKVDAAERGEESQDIAVTPIDNGKQKVSLKIPLRTGFENTLASRYRADVMAESARYNLAPSLLYAIIQTESSFNPRARSPVPAFGLMQLVPKSGGMDAYEHVYGEKLLLDPEYLYEPSNNVELGAAYLDVLNSRYLRLITNDDNRLLCTIAAYNTGAGNVARSFTGRTSVAEAARIINGMTPDEVYEHLRENLPYEETRNYIQKVTRAQDKFAPLDQQAFD